MKNLFLLSAAAAILLTGCDANTSSKTSTPAESVKTSEAVSIPTYSAETFFQTTSYSMARNNGYTFSPDGNKILASSDKSGVFNAISIDRDGTKTPLTSSETDANFALSYFPNDERILISADRDARGH